MIIDNISSKSSCSEDECFTKENSYCKDSLEDDRRCNDDILQLDLVDRLISATQFQNDDGNKSPVSVDDKSLGCQTPTESKFDPFAAGPGGIMLHAQTLNYNIGSNSEEIVETDSTEDQNAENNFFNLIFSSLLDLIISSKLMEMSVNNLTADSDQAAECKTPARLLLLTGIAETCPPAPMRRPSFSVKGFDLSICRKLNFEDCLN